MGKYLCEADPFYMLEDDYFMELKLKMEQILEEEGILGRYLLLQKNIVYFSIQEENCDILIKYDIDTKECLFVIDALFCTKNKLYIIPRCIEKVYIQNCNLLPEYYNKKGMENPEECRYFGSFVYSGGEDMPEVLYCLDSIDICDLEKAKYYESNDFLLELYKDFERHGYQYTLNRMTLWSPDIIEPSENYKSLLKIGFHYDYAIDLIEIILDAEDLLKYFYDFFHLISDYISVLINVNYKYKSLDDLKDVICLFKELICNEDLKNFEHCTYRHNPCIKVNMLYKSEEEYQMVRKYLMEEWDSARYKDITITIEVIHMKNGYNTNDFFEQHIHL